METHPLNSRKQNSKGIALVMVLWVMAILSVIALEFSFAMKTELNISQNYKSNYQGYSMAMGGVQRAIVELIYLNDPKIQELRQSVDINLDTSSNAEETPPEEEAWVSDGRTYSVPFDQGTCDVKVMSEAGKINMNSVSDKTLRKIITLLGLEGEERDIVVDSILDWISPGDLTRLNGAKEDYYQSLKEPYHCKNGPLDSIEELLLVRGVTHALFYGGKDMNKETGKERVFQAGLRDIFTVYASGTLININSASPVVLKAFLHIPDDVLERIVNSRTNRLFNSEQELLQSVPELKNFIDANPNWGNIIGYGVPGSTPYYTIESRAKLKGENSVRGIKAIVKLDTAEKTGYKILQWVDLLL